MPVIAVHSSRIDERLGTYKRNLKGLLCFRSRFLRGRESISRSLLCRLHADRQEPTRVHSNGIMADGPASADKRELVLSSVALPVLICALSYICAEHDASE